METDMHVPGGRSTAIDISPSISTLVDPGAPRSIAIDGFHHVAIDGKTFQIRPCASVLELDQCVQLQQQAWGYPDAEVVPRNMYVLAQALGGHVYAAWSNTGELAGFAMAIAAHQPLPASTGNWMQPVGVEKTLPPQPLAAPTPYLHSHMLAVAERYRNSGLGFALKQAQRADALARGIRCMRWTFDPRVAKNAFFNLHRLGATSHRFIPNFYGTPGLALQGGLPTDRLLAEWQLDSERVRAAAERKPTPRPGYTAESIELRKELASWRGSDGFSDAEHLQTELRATLEDAFARGLEVTGFTSDRNGGGMYRLSPRSID
jgi:predicted GNAT superfamily acetyltransferase